MTTNQESEISEVERLRAENAQLERVNEEQDHTIAGLIFERDEARREAAHYQALLEERPQ